MASKSPKPWEQQPHETVAQYKVFCIYRDAGEVRNVRDAYRQAYRKPNAIQATGNVLQWVKKNDWYARVREYDRHNEALRQAERENAIKSTAAAWAARAEAMHATAGDAAELAINKAKLLLEFPVSRTVSADGKTIINPIKAADMQIAMQTIKAATELYREVAPAGANEQATAEFVVVTTEAQPQVNASNGSVTDHNAQTQHSPNAPAERSLPVQ